MIQCNDIPLADLKTNAEYDLLSKLRNLGIVNNDNDENEDMFYNDSNFDCMYIENNNFFSNFKHSDYLSFFNLNVQSLPAKFNELKDLLSSFKSNLMLFVSRRFGRFKTTNCSGYQVTDLYINAGTIMFKEVGLGFT